jgi:G3E family GTPase
VDTAVLEQSSVPVEEVSGGCFCCKFDDLLGAMDRLVAREHPDVLLGEAVGSCTDLSATVLQPLKALHRGRYRLAPASVLVDPRRVRPLLEPTAATALEPAFSRDVLYIYLKQLEEADLIVVNKIDLIGPSERLATEEALRREFPQARVLSLSAREGTGVVAWLEAVLDDAEPGRTVVKVDYDRYADGEAALGWLNAAYALEADAPVDWEAFCRRVIEASRRGFLAGQAEIAHLKTHLIAGSGALAANLTSSDG